MKKNSDLYKLIKSRRSVRYYKNEPLPDTDLKLILDTGRWAPTPSNVQSWIFGTVTGEGCLQCRGPEE